MPLRTPVALVLTALVAAPALLRAEAAKDDVRVRYTKYEYRIPMRDGVKLFTAVYVPKDAAAGRSYPILLNRTPYGVAPYGTDAYREDLGPVGGRGPRGLHLRVPGRARTLPVRGTVRRRAPVPREQGAARLDETSDAWDTIDWLVKHVPLEQRPRGHLGHLVPRLLRGDGGDRRAPGARSGLAAGPDRRLVRGRRLPPQRRLLPAARLQLLLELRPPAPGADDEVGAGFDHGTAGRLPTSSSRRARCPTSTGAT